jgi:hypothetical protein
MLYNAYMEELPVNVLKQQPPNKSLCLRVEPWLVDALSHRALIVVNEAVAMKGAGDLVDIPLEAEHPVESTQIFVPGQWYGLA